MNSFMNAAGSVLAHVVDGAIDGSKAVVTESGIAATSFIAGFKAQRAKNAARRGVEVIEIHAAANN